MVKHLKVNVKRGGECMRNRVFALLGQPMACESHPGVLSHRRPQSRQGQEREESVRPGKNRT